MCLQNKPQRGFPKRRQTQISHRLEDLLAEPHVLSGIPGFPLVTLLKTCGRPASPSLRNDLGSLVSSKSHIGCHAWWHTGFQPVRGERHPRGSRRNCGSGCSASSPRRDLQQKHVKHCIRRSTGYRMNHSANRSRFKACLASFCESVRFQNNNAYL